MGNPFHRGYFQPAALSCFGSPKTVWTCSWSQQESSITQGHLQLYFMEASKPDLLQTRAWIVLCRILTLKAQLRCFAATTVFKGHRKYQNWIKPTQLPKQVLLLCLLRVCQLSCLFPVQASSREPRWIMSPCRT